MSTSADVVVIGGGIAGVSVAYELAAAGRSVVLVEREAQLAHHTTGRSAAVFLESYGPPAVRALSRASRRWIDHDSGVLDVPEILTPRQSLWLAPPDQLDAFVAMTAEIPSLEPIDPVEASAACGGVLRLDRLAAAALEADAASIDVLGLHQGYVRAGRALGVEIDPSWPVTSIQRRGESWEIGTAAGRALSAADVVIAAGAWCDVVAGLAGATPLGLVPKRRTIAICPTRAPLVLGGPLVNDIHHTYYWKPEGPNVLCSPADETPSEPCDARPEELDVALALERVNEATTLGLRSVQSSWAGLRTFAPDGVPVAGPDPDLPGLWWLAGQGGYGIQTAPAMAQTLAGLLTAGAVTDHVLGAGVSPAALAPARFRA